MSERPLIIFDCDGVLVDSEPISLAVLREALSAEGISICDRDAERLFLGRSLATMLSVVKDDYGATLGDGFLERLRRKLYTRFRAELQPTTGIADTWEALEREGFAFCVASSSQPERIRLSLEITGLVPRFHPPIFSATMVANGKPAPDLFLHAASRMEHQPEDCLVIEDSPAGIAAAKAAGMKVFAYVGATHARSEAYRAQIASLEPDLMFDAMDNLVQRARTV